MVIGLLKITFLRLRPDNALIIVASNDPSFPSGHAGVAAAFFLALAYVFAPMIVSKLRRKIFVVACVLAILIVGASRAVLNVHWASDVVAGWGIGIFLTVAVIVVVKYVSSSHFPPKVS